MSSPLNYHPPTTATHYTPAQLHLPGYLLSLLAATALSIAGAFLYIYACSHMEGYPYHIAASVAAAFAVAVLTICVMHFGKVRTRTPAILAALIISLTAVYAMWIAWIPTLVPRANIPYLALVTHPISLVRLAYHLNQLGTWTYDDYKITGLPLALLWLLEAGMPIAASLLVALTTLHDESPRCQDCNKPCKSIPDLPTFSTDREPDLLLAIETRDFPSLATHAPPSPGRELILRLHTCPHCLTTHFLNLTRVESRLNSQGRRTYRGTTLIKHLRLTPDEALLLGSTCHQILTTRSTPT